MESLLANTAVIKSADTGNLQPRKQSDVTNSQQLDNTAEFTLTAFESQSP